MLVAIRLNDEEKFQVLLLAFGLFLLALLTSICLAIASCPLNKWLLKRNEEARRRRQEMAIRQHRNFALSHQTTSQQAYYSNYYCNNHQNNKSASLSSYMGPPPAYEAALRATRLQSLTGTTPGTCTLLASTATAPPSSVAQNYRAHEEASSEESPPDWLRTALTNQSSEPTANERQLDLGDYFHPPKEPLQLVASNEFYFARQRDQGDHFAINIQRAQRLQAPVMLRLWVKLLEPGELVQRARAHTSEQGKSAAVSQPTRRSLTRQLSIPHLFGSLMTLASGKQPTAVRPMSICDKSQNDESIDASEVGKEKKKKEEEEEEEEGEGEEQVKVNLSEDGEMRQLSSMSSTLTSSSSDGGNAEPLKQGQQPAGSTQNGKHKYELEDEVPFDGRKQAKRRHHQRSGSIPAISSITSRVLHMNVASFSYVKDENLISTKKHNQLNFHHFYARAPVTAAAGAAGRAAQPTNKKEGKMCQLLVSICDIENLLNSSSLQQRACLRLAQNSSIYIKCEILAPKSSGAKSTATRLLRNPLKVLTQQESTSSTGAAGSHTINFASTLPAAAIDPTPTASRQAQLEPAAHHHYHAHPQTNSTSAHSSFASSDVTPPEQQQQQQQEEEEQLSIAIGDRAGSPDELHVNWRHEPNADGKSIVAFNPIPKQIAQQQQLASAPNLGTTTTTASSLASSRAHSIESTSCHQSIDLVQFDSVFVSPILAKSLLEEGHICLRVYSQCKYVNESCLAELKLPLKQLMRAQTRDNLGDVISANNRTTTTINTDTTVPQQQADLILNNLLANLVTASTGSPLSTLIEQISAEERPEDEEEEEEKKKKRGEGAGRGQLNDDQATIQRRRMRGGGDSFRLTDWLTSAAEEEKEINNSNSNNNNSLQRASNSLGAALNYLENRNKPTLRGKAHHWPPGGALDDCDAWPCDPNDKLIEQNYCRSLMVSHRLNYLVAPSYECQLVEEQRGQLVLGLTYLPTSNRIIFNAHRATLNLDNFNNSADKQPIKKLRLQSDTSYLLRFMMVANNRVLKRKQTACARKPEWDSQEPVTFDLVSVQVDQPSFIVALVMRNPRSLACQTVGGSLQSLTSYHQVGGGDPIQASGARPAPPGCCQSDPESLRLSINGGALHQPGSELQQKLQQQTRRGKRDLVIGHVVLAHELWHELKTQPRRQLIKQFKLL